MRSGGRMSALRPGEMCSTVLWSTRVAEERREEENASEES